MASELFDRVLVRTFVPLTIRKVVVLASWSWVMSILTWVSASNIVGVALHGATIFGGVKLSVAWAVLLSVTAVVLFHLSLIRIEHAYKRLAHQYGTLPQRGFQ